MEKKKIVALTGAGISAESGLKTFRDSGGLWEGYDVMEVATPEAWHKNPDLVLKFYNLRRAQLKEVEPNYAHKALSLLEDEYDVHVVTQNVDNLHERAGSSKVLHLHGELTKVRSSFDEDLIYHWEDDLNPGDLCDKGHQLRPHIVWFGEAVPMLGIAAGIVSQADILLIIGTSLQVYPAAGLVSYAPNSQIYYVDPEPKDNYELRLSSYTTIAKSATEGMKELMHVLSSKH